MVAQVGFVDGFDHYNGKTTAGLGLLSTWTAGNVSKVSVVGGITGVGQSVQLTSGGGLSGSIRRSIATCRKLTYNFAFDISFFNTGDFFFLQDSGGGLIMKLGFDATQSLLLYNAAGTAIATSQDDANFIVASVRFFCQVMFDNSGAAGTHTCTVKINGDEWLSVTDANFSTDNIAMIQHYTFSTASSGCVYRVDDTVCLIDWVLDTGELEVYTYGMDGEDSVQFTPLSGTNASNVDEAQADGDTTYNYSNTVGHKDLFTFPDLPFTPESIFCVTEMVAVRKVSSATRTIRNVLKVDGVEFPGEDYNLSTTHYFYFDHHTVNPSTVLPWEVPEVNALISGYELVV